jgi:hypothetical protein
MAIDSSGVTEGTSDIHQGTNSWNNTANPACQVLSYTKPTQITTIILNLTKKDTGKCSSLSFLQMSFFLIQTQQHSCRLQLRL